MIRCRSRIPRAMPRSDAVIAVMPFSSRMSPGLVYVAKINHGWIVERVDALEGSIVITNQPPIFRTNFV